MCTTAESESTELYLFSIFGQYGNIFYRFLLYKFVSLYKAQGKPNSSELIF